MTNKEVYNALVSRLLNFVNSAYPIAVDNKKYSPPDPPSHWARSNVKFNDGNQTSLGRVGNRKFDSFGFFYVQVFTPINSGTNLNNDLCQAIKEEMDGFRINDLWTYNGKVVTIGPDGEWYQQNVMVEFQYQETR